MSLIELPVIVVVAICLHICYTARLPGSTEMEPSMKDTVPARTLMGAKIIFWIIAIIEAIIVIREHAEADGTRSSSLTPVSLVGALLALIGGAIRFRCIQIMGPMYTAEVGIRKNHKLITTGPYAIVRHPAYLATYLCFIGALLWYFGRPSFLRDATTLAAKALSITVVLYIFVTSLVPLARYEKEDEILRKEFGSEWKDWAERVPYRFIPGIF